MEKQPSLELKAMGNTPGAAAPAPPWENPEYVYAEDDYDMNYDESLPSHVSVDSVSEDEDDSVDGAGTKPKSRKRKKDIPMSPEAKRKRPRGTEVGRANELLKPNEIIEQIDSRSVAASPLPHNVKLEDVQSFSAQHGNVNNVRLPKHVSDKRHFCGTALVEFSEEEEANSVTEKKLSFAGVDLELKPKKEFDTEREAKQEAYEKSNANKNGRDGGYPEGLILAFKLKKILADVDPEQIVGDKVDDTDTAKKEGASSSAEESAIGHDEEVPENADVREERSDDVEESNAADAHSLNKDGKSPLENDKQTITREDFKEYFAKFGTVRYVDFSKGDDSGYLRFEESKAAEKAHALAALSVEGGLIMKGYLVTLEPVPESSHKDRLQKFSLKKYQKYPVYVTRSEGESCDCKFWCTIEVDGQQFKSVHLHVRKKEAEQDAAKVAYEFLMARNGDNFTDVLELIDKDLLLCKTILYEFSSKKKAGQPSYSYHRQKGGRMSFFAATVCIAGKEYTGGIAKSKNAAAEKAARLAVKSILDTNDVCMLKIFRSKRRSVTATLSKKRTLKTSAPNLEAPGQTVGRVDVQFQHPGTTCSTVLTQAILTELCKAVAAGVNVMDLGKGINKAINAVTAHLKSKAWMIDSPEEINQVATIYANGEKEIGDLISKAMGIVGKDGVITIVDGKTLNNELEAVQGMKMSRGYISPYFVTDQKTQKCEMENPLILIHDKKISNMNSLLPILQISIKERRPLLIFADIEGEALSILVLNKHRAGLKICAVKAPGFGENRRANLDDLAVLTGGQVVSEDQGLDLSKVEFQMLGTAKKVTVSLDDIIILDCGGDKLQIEERCQQLRESFENSTAVFDKEKAQERLAKLSGGVAVLKIGGASEAEVGEKKDRVTDALNAARAAVKEGIVPGGGVALLYATKELDKISTSHEDEKIGVQIIKNALKAPLMTIAANAGVDGSVVIGKLLEQDNLSLGYDAAKEEYVDMIKAGIIDPVKVIRTALQDAASVSLLMATTEAAVAELPATKARIASRMPDMSGMGF